MYTINNKILYGFLGISMLLCTACMSGMQGKPRISAPFHRRKSSKPLNVQPGAMAPAIVIAPASSAVVRSQTSPQRAPTSVEVVAAVAPSDSPAPASRPSSRGSQRSQLTQQDRSLPDASPSSMYPRVDASQSPVSPASDDSALKRTATSQFRPVTPTREQVQEKQMGDHPSHPVSPALHEEAAPEPVRAPSPHVPVSPKGLDEQAPVPGSNNQSLLTFRNVALLTGVAAVYYNWDAIKAWWNGDNKPKEDPVAQALINAQVTPIEVK